MPIFVGDAHVLGTFPIGPVAGAACNATVMSREDSLDIGVMVDPAAIDDPDRFGDIVQATLDAYTANAGGRRISAQELRRPGRCRSDR